MQFRVGPTLKQRIKNYTRKCNLASYSELIRMSLEHAMDSQLFQDRIRRETTQKGELDLTDFERKKIESLLKEIWSARESLRRVKIEELRLLLTEELWNRRWYIDDKIFLSLAELLRDSSSETSFGKIVSVLLHCLERRVMDPKKKASRKAFSLMRDIALDKDCSPDQRRDALEVCGAMKDINGDLYPPSKNLFFELAFELDEAAYRESRIPTWLIRNRTTEDLYDIRTEITKKLKEEGEESHLCERLEDLYTKVTYELYPKRSLIDRRSAKERRDKTKKG